MLKARLKFSPSPCDSMYHEKKDAQPVSPKTTPNNIHPVASIRKSNGKNFSNKSGEHQLAAVDTICITVNINPSQVTEFFFTILIIFCDFYQCET